MNEQSASPPDENAIDMPSSWKRHVHPRRGGLPGRKVQVADLSEVDLCSQYADEIEKALTHRNSDPALVAAAREHRAASLARWVRRSSRPSRSRPSTAAR